MRGIYRAALVAGMCAAVVVPAGMASAGTGNQVIFLTAGNGTAATSGDGGKARDASLNLPWGVVVDGATGVMYVSEAGGNVIRKITRNGTISTYAGTGTAGDTGDGGAATSAELSYPSGLALDSAGNLYVADQRNDAVREINAGTGIITTVAGTIGTSGNTGDGGLATSATLWFPSGLAFDSAGNLYIADQQNGEIREVSKSTGDISTVAGNGTLGYSGDGGAATSAELNLPYDVSVTKAGDILIADYSNGRVREVDPTTGIITTIAGGGSGGGVGDKATSVTMGNPWSVAADPTGGFFIGAYATHIYHVDSSDILTEVVGTSATGYSGDGGLPLGAQISGRTWGMWVSPAGNLMFTDGTNDRVRFADLHPPTAVNHSATTTQGKAVTSDELAGDKGKQLKLLSWTQPHHGTVKDPSGDLTYTPAAGFTGKDSFTYTITDAIGSYAQALGGPTEPKATGTETITVTTKSGTRRVYCRAPLLTAPGMPAC